MDVLEEHLARYDAAKLRLAAVSAEWERLGRPLVGFGSQNQEQEHTLMKMMRELEVQCLKLGEVVRKQHRGPAPSAVAGISRPRSARLRAVGE